MKKLSEREEEIMGMLWSKGPLFVREIVDTFPEPRPHVNTIATFLKGLEAKGWVKRELVGNANRYEAIREADSYRRQSLKSLINRFFDGSAFNLVSALTRDNTLSSEELDELAEMIEKMKH